MATSHPYQSLPPRAFWKQAVSQRKTMELEDVYAPRFSISKDVVIVAAGSCFAQHIGKQFKTRGFNYRDADELSRIEWRAWCDDQGITSIPAPWCD